MNKYTATWRNLLEIQAFGVCTYLGEKMGIPIRHIRLFFVYASFITMGSPLLAYMGLAFLLNLRNYLRSSKKLLSNL
ncbi:PspC family transcriptional regulator [Sphingobacteriales bacterium UPWRP_1]|nr:PspC family transcriptional regulator [Sphingobacteriales bacterium TSM_CSS]PSJ76812.1 PspC family transcriptional regulator [Sphingobacteriales bacterium UPWRP_1]